MLTTGEINDLMYQVFILAVQIGGPVLLISMAVGVFVSILQAATQIHEQTLTFLPKLVVIGCILVITGSSMLQRLQELVEQVCRMIAG
ncbi:flagellar biosynthetic protein FliQ [Mediterraneibacter sp. NSJ-55]|uniref:Flagellar biosynthetic protein FliQ n=1 Tax=Mediterraneibacter hominis TaxID=2763054 RepID=A0A923LIL9_9FIRM|nr:flagellar biosynthetic protein FliQ [Mediterraneibacter hominis]